MPTPLGRNPQNRSLPPSPPKASLLSNKEAHHKASPPIEDIDDADELPPIPDHPTRVTPSTVSKREQGTVIRFICRPQPVVRNVSTTPTHRLARKKQRQALLQQKKTVRVLPVVSHPARAPFVTRILHRFKDWLVLPSIKPVTFRPLLIWYFLCYLSGYGGGSLAQWEDTDAALHSTLEFIALLTVGIFSFIIVMILLSTIYIIRRRLFGYVFTHIMLIISLCFYAVSTAIQYLLIRPYIISLLLLLNIDAEFMKGVIGNLVTAIILVLVGWVVKSFKRALEKKNDNYAEVDTTF